MASLAVPTPITAPRGPTDRSWCRTSCG